MRVATIDVGTNTVRLLVADVVGPASWTVVDQRQTVTRLGEGLAAAGALGEAPMARTLAAVGDYVARAERLAATRGRAAAPRAVRAAANGGAFVAPVHRATRHRADGGPGAQAPRRA